jgi:Tetratricopeptide repeat
MEGGESLTVQEMFGRAVETRNLGRRREAIQMLEQLKVRYSDSSRIEVQRSVALAMFLIGQYHREMKDRVTAVEKFREAIEAFRGVDDEEIQGTIAACRAQMNWSKRSFLGRFGT